MFCCLKPKQTVIGLFSCQPDRLKWVVQKQSNNVIQSLFHNYLTWISQVFWITMFKFQYKKSQETWFFVLDLFYGHLFLFIYLTCTNFLFLFRDKTLPPMPCTVFMLYVRAAVVHTWQPYSSACWSWGNNKSSICTRAPHTVTSLPHLDLSFLPFRTSSHEALEGKPLEML